MHLMVLGASRPERRNRVYRDFDCVSMHLMVLGASRLFAASVMALYRRVSMHLMVLGASRLIGAVLAGTLADRSQCT